MFGQAFYMTTKAKVAQWLLEDAWFKVNANQINSIVDSDNKSPWPWADIHPVAKLTFDRQSISHIVLNNDSGQALAFGPGLTFHSDEANMLAISGHRDTHFAVLKNIEIGDLITLERPNTEPQKLSIRNRYIIDVRKEEFRLHSDSINNTHHVILITCYPFESVERATPFRLIVEAS